MIYIITHKIFEPYFVDKKNYRVLHVGINENCKFEYLRDDSSVDNISEKNPNFCELTGLYWIWKNGSEVINDITGLVHYRRYFTTKWNDFLYTYFGKKPRVLSYKKIERSLRRADIILPISEKIYRTVRRSYIDVHNEEDLVLTRDSIAEVSPEYLKAFDEVMNSHKYYYANMMICKKNILDDYSKWLFAVLFNLEKKIDINKYEDSYQKRVFGFLSERLLQVWVYHNNLKVKEYPVFNTESRRLNFFDKNRNRFKKIYNKLKK